MSSDSVEAGPTSQHLQQIRLRLPRRPGYHYVLRQVGVAVDEAAFPGAEALLCSDDLVVMAPSPSHLLRANDATSSLVGSLLPKMLVLDLARTMRAIGRPVADWSAETRGTIVEFDDLCWDAAATCEDHQWATELRDPSGPHQLYNYVWGDAATLPAPEVRRALWSTLVRGLLQRSDMQGHPRPGIPGTVPRR